MSALSGPTWPIDVREGDSALFAEFFSALRNLQTDFNEDKLTAFLRIVDGEIGSRKLKDRDAAMRLLSWLAIIIRNRFPDGVGGYNVLRIASALSAALVDLDNGVVGSIVAPTVRSHRSRDKLAIAVLKAGCLLVIEHRVASGVSRAEAERQILSRNGAMVSAFGAWGRSVTKKNLATWEREGRKPDSFLREIYIDQKEVFDRYATMAGSIEAGIQQYVAHLLISYAPSQIGG